MHLISSTFTIVHFLNNRINHHIPGETIQLRISTENNDFAPVTVIQYDVKWYSFIILSRVIELLH